MKTVITKKGTYVKTVNPLTKEVLHISEFYEDCDEAEVRDFELDIPSAVEKELVKIVKEVFDGIDDIDDIYCDEDFFTNGYEYQIFYYVEEERTIEIEADYFSVQRMVDGFGYDTCTDACFATYEEAVKYIDEYGGTLVPQKWGYYHNNFN